MFDEFWEAYPRKAGRKAALRAWSRIRPDAALHEKILAAVGRAKTGEMWRRDGGRYIPDPANWLRDGRWDDAPPPPPPAGGGTGYGGAKARPRPSNMLSPENQREYSDEFLARLSYGEYAKTKD